MASAVESWVRVQLLLRCLQHPEWELLIGGPAHDFVLLNTETAERRTIEVKSRQAIPGWTRKRSNSSFGAGLWGDQAQANFLIFCWFDQERTYILPIQEMRLGHTNGRETRRRTFKLDNDPTLGAWERLFE